MSAAGPGAVLRVSALPVQRIRVGRPVACAAPPPALATAPVADDFARGFEDGRAAGWAEGLRLGQEEGRTQGAAQAVQQAREEAQARLQEALEPLQAAQARLQALHASLNASLEAIRGAAEDEIAALCFELVCRVLGPRAVDAEALRAQVLHLLQQASGQRQLAVHVHPQDLPSLQALGPLAEGWAWKADEAVSLGGCMLDTDAGTLDARLDTTLDACKAAILRARQARELGE